jgi:hypothetical protein
MVTDIVNQPGELGCKFGLFIIKLFCLEREEGVGKGGRRVNMVEILHSLV